MVVGPRRCICDLSAGTRACFDLDDPDLDLIPLHNQCSEHCPARLIYMTGGAAGNSSQGLQQSHTMNYAMCVVHIWKYVHSQQRGGNRDRVRDGMTDDCRYRYSRSRAAGDGFLFG